MKLTNNQIYNLASSLTEIANSNTYIPAKANFFIQKNITTIAKAAQEIDKSRISIAQHYGTLNEEGTQYSIPQEKAAAANQELNDLFGIEQDLEIKTFKIDDLGDIQFTTSQMQAIMFMIED